MAKKKINPRRRPATQEDLKRVKNEATSEGIKRTFYLVLYVLIEKHGASYEDIRKLADEINYYADSIIRNYVTWKDIEHVVVDEYDVRLPW